MIDRDTLAKNYATKSDDELLELHASETLTKLAYEVIELELKKRNLEIPPPKREQEKVKREQEEIAKKLLAEQYANKTDEEIQTMLENRIKLSEMALFVLLSEGKKRGMLKDEQQRNSQEQDFAKKTDQELLELFTSNLMVTSKHELNSQNDITKEMAARGVIVPATSGQRIGNYIIDMIIVYALFYLLGMTDLGTLIENNARSAFPVIYLLYYISLEAGFGQTLGKLVTGTKVVNKDSTSLTLERVIGRALCRLIPFEILSFVGRRPRGWHDSISKTMVISIKSSSEHLTSSKV